MKKIITILVLASSMLNAECTTDDIKYMSKSGYSKDEIKNLCGDKTIVNIEENNQVVKSDENKGHSSSSKSFYIGLGAASGSGTNTYSDGLDEYEEDIDNSSNMVKVGWLLRRDNRFEISSETITTKYTNNSEDTLTGLNFDWQFTYPNNNFAPYWTVGLGAFTWEDTAQYFVSNEDLSGLSFNYGFGGLYSINETLELDIGFKGKVINWQDVEVSNSYYYTDTIETSTNMSMIYFGLNVKF